MSQEKKLFVVVGATGTQGTSIISHFLEYEPSYKIRGLTRSLTSPKSRTLTDQGVEMVQADLNDLESLRRAFQGAQVIYAYTDYAGCSQSAEAQEAVSSGKAKTLAEGAGQVELQQGKNIADAASSIPTLERLIWSRIVDAEKLSGGKYAGVAEMQSKAEASEYISAQEALKGKVSSVIWGVFTDIVLRAPEAFGWEENGKGNGYSFRVPVSGKSSIEWVDMQTDAGSWVSTLLKTPAGTTAEAVSGTLSFDELAAIVANQLNVEVDVKTLSLEEYAGDDDTGLMLDVGKLWQYAEEFGVSGGEKGVFKAEEFEKQGFHVKQTPAGESFKQMDWSPLLR